MERGGREISFAAWRPGRRKWLRSPVRLRQNLPWRSARLALVTLLEAFHAARFRRDPRGPGACAAVLRAVEASAAWRQPRSGHQGLQEGAQRGRGARGRKEASAGAVERGHRSVLQHGWMSLRVQLVLLFTAVLAATLLVASALGLRIAQRSVEEEIRKRTAELASATTLAMKHAGNDDDQISEELAATVRTHRGILRAELARQAALGIDADFTAAHIEAG